jgi:hypothetical protein
MALQTQAEAVAEYRKWKAESPQFAETISNLQLLEKLMAASGQRITPETLHEVVSAHITDFQWLQAPPTMEKPRGTIENQMAQAGQRVNTAIATKSDQEKEQQKLEVRRKRMEDGAAQENAQAAFEKELYDIECHMEMTGSRLNHAATNSWKSDAKKALRERYKMYPQLLATITD